MFLTWHVQATLQAIAHDSDNLSKVMRRLVSTYSPDYLFTIAYPADAEGYTTELPTSTEVNATSTAVASVGT